MIAKIIVRIVGLRSDRDVMDALPVYVDCIVSATILSYQRRSSWTSGVLLWRSVKAGRRGAYGGHGRARPAKTVRPRRT